MHRFDPFVIEQLGFVGIEQHAGGSDSSPDSAGFYAWCADSPTEDETVLIFSPTGKAPWLVTVGRVLQRDAVYALARRAGSLGLPRDSAALTRSSPTPFHGQGIPSTVLL